MGDDFFRGLMRWQVPEHGVHTPLFFADLGAFALVHTAASEAVRPLLPDVRWRLVEVMPGRCLVVLAALQYRDSDLGPYNELSIAFPVAADAHPLPVFDALRQGLARASSVWIWQMPVSTDVACRVGVGIAGFPKRVAELRFSLDGGRAHAALIEDGAPVLQMACPLDDAPGERTLRLRSYTVKDGVPLQSLMLMRQRRWRDHLQRDTAQLTLGAGALADTLRTLQLSERPLASHCCPQAQAVLFHPRNLRDD